MHVLSAHAHDCMDVLVKVVDIILYPSCAIMQMQGVHGVCGLRALASYVNENFFLGVL